MLSILHAFIRRPGAYDDARAFARNRRYIDQRRKAALLPPERDLGPADNPGFFVVLLEAWRHRNAQAKRARRLEAKLRNLTHSWVISVVPDDSSDEFKAGYNLARQNVIAYAERSLDEVA